MVRMRAWAPSAIKDTVHGVGNVGDVVRGIDIFAVPATGKGDLHADSIRTRHVGEAGKLEIFVGALALAAETANADGSAVEVGSGSTLDRVSGNHPEAGRERVDLVVVGARAMQVVDVHATGGSIAVSHDGHVPEGAVRVAVVELGGPVGGHVLLDVAGAADRVASILKVHAGVEAITAAQDVGMLRDSAGLGDGIDALVIEAATATDHERSLDRKQDR